jgi:nucleotide-binding universal stress UspA family protein
MAYRNVVVGTDGSETAEKAVAHAAALAKTFGARLTIVTAYVHDKMKEARKSDSLPYEMQWMAKDVNEAEARAKRGKAVAKQLGVSDVKIVTGTADPAMALIEAAEANGGDLIVTGNRGITQATRAIKGNVPNKVTHHAPCDVLIVHTTDG